MAASTSTSLPVSDSSTSAPQKGAVVCVFCGSFPGTSPAHLTAARALAHTMHTHSISLVYGGGTVGLMGELARTLVSLSGPSSVHGIIPSALVQYEQKGRASGVPQAPIDESLYGRTTVVADMHSRKHRMAQEVMAGGPGSGFVALSGGYGTVEELMEMVTWNQLGIHGVGVVVYNVEGYYDGLLAWVRGAVEGGFVSAGNSGIMVEAGTAEEVVRALREYKVSADRLELNWGQN